MVRFKALQSAKVEDLKATIVLALWMTLWHLELKRSLEAIGKSVRWHIIDCRKDIRKILTKIKDCRTLPKRLPGNERGIP